MQNPFFFSLQSEAEAVSIFMPIFRSPSTLCETSKATGLVQSCQGGKGPTPDAERCVRAPRTPCSPNPEEKIIPAFFLVSDAGTYGFFPLFDTYFPFPPPGFWSSPIVLVEKRKGARAQKLIRSIGMRSFGLRKH